MSFFLDLMKAIAPPIATTRSQIQIIGLTTSHAIAMVPSPSTNVAANAITQVPKPMSPARGGSTLARVGINSSIIANHIYIKTSQTNLSIHVSCKFAACAAANISAELLFPFSKRAISLLFEVL